MGCDVCNTNLAETDPTPEFEAWLEKMNMLDQRGRMGLVTPQNPALRRLIAEHRDAAEKHAGQRGLKLSGISGRPQQGVPRHQMQS